MTACHPLTCGEVQRSTLRNNVTDSLTLRYQRFCIFSGVAFAVLFFFALYPVAGFIPPPSPMLSGEQLIDLYRDRFAWVKLAMPIGIVAAGFSIPWNALIAAHIARIELRHSAMPMLAITSFGAGIVNTVLFFLPFIFWSAGYFRIDRNPELVLLISDLSWLEVVMVVTPACIQCVTIALAGFMDRDENPVFPRWSCFAVLWVGVLLLPGIMGIFFFQGPFAFNGLIVFWLVAAAFAAEIGVLAFVMYRHRSPLFPTSKHRFLD